VGSSQPQREKKKGGEEEKIPKADEIFLKNASLTR